jgi:hypothetical protein
MKKKYIFLNNDYSLEHLVKYGRYLIKESSLIDCIHEKYNLKNDFNINSSIEMEKKSFLNENYLNVKDKYYLSILNDEIHSQQEVIIYFLKRFFIY